MASITELQQLVNAEVAALIRRRPGLPAYPFHYAALRVAAKQAFPPKTPLPSADAMIELSDTVFNDDEAFVSGERSERVLGELVDTLRAELLAVYDPTVEKIEVLVCNKKLRNADGELINCCVESELERGCDEGAGTAYYAKTNGRQIWFAGLMRDKSSRSEGYSFIGIPAGSLLLFALLHEFGHVLYLNARTRGLFEEVYQYYNRLAAVLDPTLRNTHNVIVGDIDFNEFQASVFAFKALQQ